MRGSLAAISADRVSSCAVLLAGISCGVLVLFVGLPLARSSPFPTPRDGGWTVHGRPYATARMAAPAAAIAAEKPQRAIEWELLIPSAGLIEIPELGAAPAPARTRLAARTDDPEYVGSVVRSAPPVHRPAGTMDEVDEYLWAVYQRQPVKRDSSGDFSWKDPAAAKRARKSLKDYVVGGMDRDFREQLYHAGRAMDAAGLNWSILSAFRDDYRQSLASGYKASTGNSLHGGSRRTGGYGHGRAVDVMDADGNHAVVWRWLDRHGAKYGLIRPMPGYDPAHIQPRYNWRDVAVALRTTRIKTARAAGAQVADNSASAARLAKAR